MLIDKIKIIIKMEQANTFIPMPNKKPLNVPQAALKTLFISEESNISSPTKAPIKGPRITPKGPAKNPRINPTIEPQVPCLLPPDFFVKKGGKKLSAILTNSAITPVIINVKTEIFE